MSGPEFANLRHSLGLTQVALAAKLGCTSIHLSRLENRAVVPPVFALALRALAFGAGALDRDAA